MSTESVTLDDLGERLVHPRCEVRRMGLSGGNSGGLLFYPAVIVLLFYSVSLWEPGISCLRLPLSAPAVVEFAGDGLGVRLEPF